MALSTDRKALKALEEDLGELVRIAQENSNAATAKRIREGLAAHLNAVETAREITDSVSTPRTSFDPSDPKVIGRMVSIALITQPFVPLGDVRPEYGSGVYAIYYDGDHPLYRRIRGTETPIYVGKADPDSHDANTPREQGTRLTDRLIDHKKSIKRVETYAEQNALPPGLAPIHLCDFKCRYMVCATNAQLAAERHLILMFQPLWNKETRACWGMSKHGDAATTRANKRSPWDVVHPGRSWALASETDKFSPNQIAAKIDEVLDKVPAYLNHALLLEKMLETFRQRAKTTEDETAEPIDGKDAEKDASES